MAERTKFYSGTLVRAESVKARRPQARPLQPTEWQDRAACLGVDPEIFFPERGGSSKPARAICAGCEVREDCLEANIKEPFGVVGGTSERERRRLRLQRSRRRTAAA